MRVTQAESDRLKATFYNEFYEKNSELLGSNPSEYFDSQRKYVDRRIREHLSKLESEDEKNRR